MKINRALDREIQAQQKKMEQRLLKMGSNTGNPEKFLAQLGAQVRGFANQARTRGALR